MINESLRDLSAFAICASLLPCGFGSAASIRTRSTERQNGSAYTPTQAQATLTWRKTKRAVDALFDARLATARERIARNYPATEYSFPGHPYPARRQPRLRSAPLLTGPDDRWPTASTRSYPGTVNDGADDQALREKPLSNWQGNPMHMLNLGVLGL